MAECLPGRQKSLSSNPHTLKKKIDRIAKLIMADPYDVGRECISEETCLHIPFIAEKAIKILI